ncbi:hypothetical protein AHF37_11852 [Paragonimus kellicotti]|nr:hypothetical protein AHF37_11852 [Paragonimus kellicotti]
MSDGIYAICSRVLRVCTLGMAKAFRLSDCRFYAITKPIGHARFMVYVSLQCTCGKSISRRRLTTRWCLYIQMTKAKRSGSSR